jgi:hypothetical protein
MGIKCHASRLTTKAFGAGDQTLVVASGAPLQVCGICFTSRAAATIWTVKNGSDDTLFTVAVTAADTSFNLDVQWLADGGLKITSDKTDGSVAVFHNNPGN